MDRIRQPTAWSVKLIRIVGRNSLRYCLQVCISGSQLRAIFTPWGHLEMWRHLWLSPLGVGWSSYWHLVGRGQGAAAVTMRRTAPQQKSACSKCQNSGG